MRIHIDQIRFKSGTPGQRDLDLAHVNNLAEKIAKYGLYQPLVVVKAGKKDDVMTYDGRAGFHRDAAIHKLRGMAEKTVRELGTRHDKEGKLVPGRSFEELFPDDKIECVVVDADDADAALSVENTARKDLTQPELCTHVWSLAEAEVDQHEIASRCNINQGRVSEFLSFHKAIPQAHDAWIDDLISHRDMLALVALTEPEQKALLEKLTTAGRGAGGDGSALSAKEAKQAKAEVRKQLQGAAKATKRTYQNAGKPSRKRLSILSERVSTAAKKGDEGSRSFFSIVDLVFSFVDGKIDEKKFAKAAQEYGATDVFTEPEKPAKEPKPAKAVKEPKPAKPAKEPKPAKPAKEPKPAKAVKEPKPKKPAKAAKVKAPKEPKPKTAGAKKPGKPKTEKPVKASKSKKAKKSA